MDETIQMLRSAGLRLTQPRRAVLGCLVEAGDHLTALDVHRRVTRWLPGITLPTVYAVLGDLAAAGVVREVHGAPGPTRYDPKVARHHHLMCRVCGALTDVPCAELDESQPCLQTPASIHGWGVEAAEVTYHGVCPACRPAPGDDAEGV